jgi:hypothetical protein
MNPTPNAATNETGAAPPTDGSESRENNGRFAKGNRGGTGNPFARQTARLRQAMLDAVSPEDMNDVICAMKKKAADGDVPAAKLLMSYCIGKPTAPENPDTLDLHELNTIIANHLDSAEGPLNVIKGMPLSVIVNMFRIILPILLSDKVKLAKEVLCAPLTEDEIEDNRADEEEEDDSPTSAAEPARDPMENIPQWMRDIGKESEPPTPKPAGKRKKAKKTAPAAPEQTSVQSPAEPARQPAVDADLLRVLLERARQLKAANPNATGDELANSTAAQELAELLRSRNGQHPPSTNGSNGKPHGNSQR